MKILRAIFFFVYEVMETVTFIGSLFIVVYLFIAQPNQVSGISMVPTFTDGDYIITSKVTYQFRDYNRGDVVVFKSPKNQDIEFIKRVIGIPGDIVLIENREVFVNGIQLTEPYIASKTVLRPTDFMKDGVEITVPPGRLFVMGDNRPRSSDSRAFGPVRMETIVGQVIYRYLPPQKAGNIENPFPEQLQ